MSKKLQKALKHYLFKKWFRKHPKTHSFTINGNASDRGSNTSDFSATQSDVDYILFYADNNEKEEEEVYVRRRHRIHAREEKKSPAGNFLLESRTPRFADSPVVNLRGSNSDRFFVNVGSSSSLIEDAQLTGVTNTTMSRSGGMTRSTSHGNTGQLVKSPCIPNGFTKVMKHSSNPYYDFRRSMQKVAEARPGHHSSSTIDWDFMEVLLFSYLSLNDKKAHSLIMNAFVDVAVDLCNSKYNKKIPVAISG